VCYGRMTKLSGRWRKIGGEIVGDPVGENSPVPCRRSGFSNGSTTSDSRGARLPARPTRRPTADVCAGSHARQPKPRPPRPAATPQAAMTAAPPHFGRWRTAPLRDPRSTVADPRRSGDRHGGSARRLASAPRDVFFSDFSPRSTKSRLEFVADLFVSRGSTGKSRPARKTPLQPRRDIDARRPSGRRRSPRPRRRGWIPMRKSMRRSLRQSRVALDHAVLHLDPRRRTASTTLRKLDEAAVAGAA